MWVRVVTALGILVPVFAAPILRRAEYPSVLAMFFVALVAFGTGRFVEWLVDPKQTKTIRRLGWALMIGSSAISAGYVVVSVRGDLDRKLALGLFDAGPAPLAEPWEHHPGAWKDVAVGAGGVCGVKGDGAIACWGDPKYGWPEKESVLALDAGAKAEKVALGAFGACAMVAGGDVVCWRASDLAAARAPEKLALAHVVALAIGMTHACALDAAGAAQCWGKTIDALPSGPTPAPVGGLPRVKRIAAGHQESCAVTIDGKVLCWGALAFAHAGAPARESATPVAIDLPSPASDVALGPTTACAVLDDGQAYCWGTVVESEAPVRVPGLADVALLAIGPRHLCAAMKNRHVRCKGKNDQGQLATPDLRDAGFASGSGLGDITALAAGEHATCAVDSGSDPELICWGKRARTRTSP